EIRTADRNEVLWLPDVSRPAHEWLVELGISWVTDSGDVHVHAPWGLVTADARPPAVTETEGSRPRLSRGALATLQVLLERPVPLSQQEIAPAAGITQPRVSQVLKDLRGEGLADRTARGWQATEPRRALDVWLSGASSPA